MDGEVLDRKKLPRMDLTLLEILTSSNARNAFHHFLNREFSAENLLFHESVTLYQTTWETNTDENRRLNAEEIFKRFLNDDASEQVNISHIQRMNVKKLYVEKGPIFDVFDKPATEVLQMMSRDGFTRFKLTEAFKNLKL